MTTEMPTQLEGSKVDSFIQLEQKKWDEDVLLDILDICNERDRRLIKKITLPTREGGDTLYWFPEEEGCFTVRSCYRLIQEEIEFPHAQFWKKIVELKTSWQDYSFLMASMLCVLTYYSTTGCRTGANR